MDRNVQDALYAMTIALYDYGVTVGAGSSSMRLETVARVARTGEPPPSFCAGPSVGSTPSLTTSSPMSTTSSTSASTSYSAFSGLAAAWATHGPTLVSTLALAGSTPEQQFAAFVGSPGVVALGFSVGAVSRKSAASFDRVILHPRTPIVVSCPDCGAVVSCYHSYAYDLVYGQEPGNPKTGALRQPSRLPCAPCSALLGTRVTPAVEACPHAFQPNAGLYAGYFTVHAEDHAPALDRYPSLADQAQTELHKLVTRPGSARYIHAIPFTRIKPQKYLHKNRTYVFCRNLVGCNYRNKCDFAHGPLERDVWTLFTWWSETVGRLTNPSTVMALAPADIPALLADPNAPPPKSPAAPKPAAAAQGPAARSQKAAQGPASPRSKAAKAQVAAAKQQHAKAVAAKLAGSPAPAPTPSLPMPDLYRITASQQPHDADLIFAFLAESLHPSLVDSRGPRALPHALSLLTPADLDSVANWIEAALAELTLDPRRPPDPGHLAAVAQPGVLDHNIMLVDEFVARNSTPLPASLVWSPARAEDPSAPPASTAPAAPPTSAAAAVNNAAGSWFLTDLPTADPELLAWPAIIGSVNVWFGSPEDPPLLLPLADTLPASSSRPHAVPVHLPAELASSLQAGTAPGAHISIPIFYSLPFTPRRAAVYALFHASINALVRSDSCLWRPTRSSNPYKQIQKAAQAAQIVDDPTGPLSRSQTAFVSAVVDPLCPAARPAAAASVVCITGLPGTGKSHAVLCAAHKASLIKSRRVLLVMHNAAAAAAAVDRLSAMRLNSSGSSIGSLGSSSGSISLLAAAKAHPPVLLIDAEARPSLTALKRASIVVSYPGPLWALAAATLPRDMFHLCLVDNADAYPAAFLAPTLALCVRSDNSTTPIAYSITGTTPRCDRGVSSRISSSALLASVWSRPTMAALSKLSSQPWSEFVIPDRVIATDSAFLAPLAALHALADGLSAASPSAVAAANAAAAAGTVSTSTSRSSLASAGNSVGSLVSAGNSSANSSLASLPSLGNVASGAAASAAAVAAAATAAPPLPQLAYPFLVFAPRGATSRLDTASELLSALDPLPVLLRTLVLVPSSDDASLLRPLVASHKAADVVLLASWLNAPTPADVILVVLSDSAARIHDLPRFLSTSITLGAFVIEPPLGLRTLSHWAPVLNALPPPPASSQSILDAYVAGFDWPIPIPDARALATSLLDLLASADESLLPSSHPAAPATTAALRTAADHVAAALAAINNARR